jgi:hypothetical protein
MPTTVFPRSMVRATTYQAAGSETIVTVSDWTIVWTWEVSPPAAGNWHVAASVDCDTDPGVRASLRLRTGGGGTSTAALVDKPLRRLRLGWMPISTAPTKVHLESRREFGAGGIRVVRAEVAGVSSPPVSQIPGPGYPAGYIPPTSGPYPDQYTDDYPYGTDAGTGFWRVSDQGQILTPDGVEFVTGGLNGGVTIDVGGAATQLFGGPAKTTGSVAWAWEKFPGDFQVHADIWPGDTNVSSGNEVFPGGTVSPAPDQFAAGANAGTGGFAALPDRVYAMTGVRSPDAIAKGIAAPVDHWHNQLYRVAALPRPGPLTWNTANYMTPGSTIPQYVARARELVDLGLTVSVQNHALTGSDPVLPAALIANPTLDPLDPALAAPTFDNLRDSLQLIDALCDEFTAADALWIGLPNEAYASARSVNYDDFVVTLVRRCRANGWTGIVTVPTGQFAGDLAGLATGAYDSLAARLEAAFAADNLVWEWHNYGRNAATGTVYTYAAVDSHLTACRNGVPGSGRRYAVWMAEYGQATPVGTGAAGPDAWNREAVLIMATATYGQALGDKHRHICPTWWATGDNSFDSSYALTYGAANKGNEAGPDPNNTGAQPGTYPWWDVTTAPLRDEWLTPGGRAHWDLSHTIWTDA